MKLIALLAALLVGWAAGARIARPVTREAGDRPPARAAEMRRQLPDMRIGLNQAPAAELMLLPGIGPRLAEAIVADRAAGGPYRRLEDLTRVKWIGPVVVERIAPYVVVEAAGERADGPPDDPAH